VFSALLLVQKDLPLQVFLDLMAKVDGSVVVEEEMLLMVDIPMVEVKVVDLVDHMLVEEMVPQHHLHRTYLEIMLPHPQEVAAEVAAMDVVDKVVLESL
tara:strand:+ start:757 stop:1053 length:297 start_codon:yes stop_codon:yes gene_type:complete